MKSQAILSNSVWVRNQSLPRVYIWYGSTPIAGFVVLVIRQPWDCNALVHVTLIK